MAGGSPQPWGVRLNFQALKPLIIKYVYIYNADKLGIIQTQ